MRTEDFSYFLPSSLIAQNPVYPRDASRLMILNRKQQTIGHKKFKDLPVLLREGDMLVFNESRVIPARIKFNFTGRDMEILLTRELKDGTWSAMIRPGKYFKQGNRIVINGKLSFIVKSILKDGQRILEFSSKGSHLREILNKIGEAPYPPYIKNTRASFDDYQTIYAKKKGSVAAPTAGLHFTDNVFSALKKHNIKTAFITLHIGPGTFFPVKSEKIYDHQMHSEFFNISRATAAKLNKTKEDGGRIIAVGTTCVRVLETAFQNGKFQSMQGETDIFIYPGYKWKCIDGILTNFHLPKSTLIMLVCSFGGRDFIMRAYKEAVAKKYRFYSFGDAMLID